MKPTNWKAAAELIGIAAIVASLIFVGLELRQSQQIAFAGRQHEQTEREFAVQDLISKNVDLILKMDNSQILDEREEILASQMERAIRIAYFFSYTQAIYLSNENVLAPVRAFAVLLHRHPGLEAVWRQQTETRNVLYGAMADKEFRGPILDFDTHVDEYLRRAKDAGF